MGALASGVGAVAGSVPFALSLNCTAGATVAITLSDNVDTSNQSDTLKLAAESTATGVGVQILNGSTPVLFGPDSAVAGNVHQWVVGASPSGPLQIPLSARYIRTAGAFNPGTVIAKATFTMSYQ